MFLNTKKGKSRIQKFEEVVVHINIIDGFGEGIYFYEGDIVLVL